MFYKIFEGATNEKIRGVASNEPILAIASETHVIFGEIEPDFEFTENGRHQLTGNLSGDTGILEFKFITPESVLLCNERECCVCNNNQFFNESCVTLINIPIKSVKAAEQTENNMLFLNIVHGKANSSFLSFKYENGSYNQIGKSKGRNSKESQYKSLLAFSYGRHTYFVNQITRENIVSCVMQNFYQTNLTDSNSMIVDIVVSQFCSNDESETLVSHSEMQLSCGKYDPLIALEGSFAENDLVYRDITKNIINGATFLQKKNMLVASFQDSDKFSFLCSFKMEDIALEFSRTWNYCYSGDGVPKTFNCKKMENQGKEGKEGCLYSNILLNNHNPKISNEDNCDSINSLTNKTYAWIDDYNLVYGFILDKDIFSMIYGPIFSSKTQLIIVREKLLSKVTYPIVHYLDGIPYQNETLFAPWDLKDGIVYVDPVKQNAVYFKDATCTKEKCYDILQSHDLNCEICEEDVPNSCIIETLCAPLWQKIEDKALNISNEKLYHRGSFSINYRGIIRRLRCNSIGGGKKGQTCSNILEDYLTTSFSTPKTKLMMMENNSSTKDKPISGNTVLIAVMVVVGSLLLLTISFIFLFCKYKSKILKHRYVKKETNEKLINNEKLQIIRPLGSGIGGVVHLANYRINNTRTVKAAVKILTCNNRAEAMQEIQTLRSCDHPNITSFFGWTEASNQLRIIAEFMAGGELHNYLVTPNRLMMVSTAFSYIFQVLDAMIYLSHKHILHRDLATRNCLLDENFEIVKVNDFGLSREMNINYEYIGGEAKHKIPFRWMSLEMLENNIFTIKGDIWSFGVLIWEIFERGACPYKNRTMAGVKSFLRSGNRLPRSRHCPLPLYNIMLLCWEKNPEKRPNFDSLKMEMKIVFNKIKEQYPDTLNQILEVDQANH